MLTIQQVGYTHPDKSILFTGLNLTVGARQKVALVGNNGTGKSTLLQIMAGLLPPTTGQVLASTPPFYVPQYTGQLHHLTVAQALGVADKLTALRDILSGRVNAASLAALNDDWTIEQRLQAALQHWDIAELSLDHSLATLSGGQKTRRLLAAVTLQQPALVLLDEPSNHLDAAGRRQLCAFVETSPSTLLVVSHDRQLLHQFDTIVELTPQGLTRYGGNYAFYVAQKQVASAALHQQLSSQQKALRHAQETERAALARKQKLDARGKKKQEQAGLPAVVLGKRRNGAENSAARLQGTHAEKVATLAQQLGELRQMLPSLDRITFGLAPSALHPGKVLVEAHDLNYAPSLHWLWQPALRLQLRSGERVALQGPNGAGKTTLLRLLLGQLAPQSGTLYRADYQAVYVDQDYSLLRPELTVYAQAQQANATALVEHEVKIRLARFLFGKDDWAKSCAALSGGEQLRLLLCCLTLRSHAPDLIALDEPTNNLDSQNVDLLAQALADYHGTLVVVSHDASFLAQVGIHRTIDLP